MRSHKILERQGRNYVLALDCSLPKDKADLSAALQHPPKSVPSPSLQSDLKASCGDWLIPSFPTPSRAFSHGAPASKTAFLSLPNILTFYSPFRSSPKAASSMKSPCLSADSCSSWPSSACSLSFTWPVLTAVQRMSPCLGHDLFGSVER